jgi:hypothetical protein
MNAMLFGTVARERPGMHSEPPQPDRSLDGAWIVLEAANDLRDDTTIEICRRVIDATLNGTPTSSSDLHVISEYFR